MRLVRNWGRCHRAMQAPLRKLSRSVLTAWTRSSPMYMGPSLGVGGRLCPSCSSNRWPACARHFLHCRTFLHSSAKVIYVQITGDCQFPALDLNFLVICRLQFQGNRNKGASNSRVCECSPNAIPQGTDSWTTSAKGAAALRTQDDRAAAGAGQGRHFAVVPV